MLSPDLLNLLACPQCGFAKLAESGPVLACAACGKSYPVLEDIPICLTSEAECNSIVEANPGSNSTPASFYNREDRINQYFNLRELPEELRRLKTLTDLSGPGPVLEIGSGGGAFQNHFPEYLALDYSFLALRRFIEPRHPRICASAERLPFRSDCFKLVLTVAALEHVPGPDRAFAEIFRVLKPGGIGYVFPAWHCQPWNCEGLPVRPYRDLTWTQKLIKLSLPLRESLVWKALAQLPRRLLRAFAYRLSPRPTTLIYQTLPANYQTFWMSDSDACSSLDSFEGILFFKSRGCPILHPGPALLQQLFFRHQPVIFQKPASPVSAAGSPN